MSNFEGFHDKNHISWKETRIENLTEIASLSFHESILICEKSSLAHHHPFKNKKLKYQKKEKSKSGLGEGVYFLGGFDDEKAVSSDLYFLKLWCKPLRFSKIATSGKKPCPRFEHGMHYMKSYNMMVVLHGRNALQKHQYLDSIFGLNMSNMSWFKI